MKLAAGPEGTKRIRVLRALGKMSSIKETGVVSVRGYRPKISSRLHRLTAKTDVPKTPKDAVG